MPYLRENLPETTLGELFPDDPIPEQEASKSLSDAVRSDMPCSILRDKITKGWRDERRIYELSLPNDQWLVDIAAADSIAAINAEIANEVRDSEEPVPTITVSDLTGESRLLTTAIADWVRSLTLDDGSRALGIQYLSKHGADLPAYAIWLRATDDGSPESEPVVVRSSRGILSSDADLHRAAAIHRMTVIP